MKRLFIFQISLLLITTLPAFSQLNKKTKEPVHSIEVMKESFRDFSITGKYYPIEANMKRGTTEILLNKDPKPKQALDYAKETPSYVFMIHTGEEIIHVVKLLQENKGDVAAYSFHITNVGSKETALLPLTLRGDITEHRAKELINNEYDRDSKYFNFQGGKALVFYKGAYTILPFEKIKQQVMTLVNTNALYLKNVALSEIEIKPVHTPERPGKSIAREVDNYKLNQVTVDVTYFDPYQSISLIHPEYTDAGLSKSKQEQLFQEYSHKAAFYLFRVKDDKGKMLRFYCLKGNGVLEQKGTDKAIYKLEVIKAEGLARFDPNVLDYKSNIIKTVSGLEMDGMLYESKQHAENLKRIKIKTVSTKAQELKKKTVSFKEIKDIINPLIIEDLGL